jgi:phenylacetic acid degradation operon negative regulatory protein
MPPCSAIERKRLRTRQLARELWDLPAWADRAIGLLGELAGLNPDTTEALAPGFELSASVLRHLQADPLLPDELLPRGWPGVRLRADYDGWDARYRATLQDWSSTQSA